jgi:hypothetical protein
MQVQTTVASGAARSSRYSGFFSSLSTIYREEGLRGWFHGFAPAVCSVAVFWTCYFPCYEYGKGALADASGLPQSSSWIHMGAAAGAGLITDVITNPFWVVRTVSGDPPRRSESELPRVAALTPCPLLPAPPRASRSKWRPACRSRMPLRLSPVCLCASLRSDWPLSH